MSTNPGTPSNKKNGKHGVLGTPAGKDCEHLILESVEGDPEYAWRCVGCGKMFTKQEIDFWETETGTEPGSD